MRAETLLPAEWTDPVLHLKNPKTQLALRVQHAALNAVRDELTRQGFVEFLAPIIGPVTDPGIRGAKQGVIDYYGREYRVMSSGILYKQLGIQAFPKMFFNAPNLRMEPPETATTGRHLAEFYQVDCEVRDATYDQAMDVAEALVHAAVAKVSKELGKEVQEVFGRKIAPLAKPFPRLSHAEAVAKLVALGRKQDPRAEINWENEEFLSKHMATGFFIKDYPKGSRGFYDKEDPKRPGILLDFDLLLPDGYGEVVSGAQRESAYDKVLARMRETGENPAKYGWYVKMLRDGVPPSAGFGLGVERITRYLCGADAVWRVRPYPKVPGQPCP